MNYGYQSLNGEEPIKLQEKDEIEVNLDKGWIQKLAFYILTVLKLA